MGVTVVASKVTKDKKEKEHPIEEEGLRRKSIVPNQDNSKVCFYLRQAMTKYSSIQRKGVSNGDNESVMKNKGRFATNLYLTQAMTKYSSIQWKNVHKGDTARTS